MDNKQSRISDKTFSDLTTERLLVELANCEEDELGKFRKKWEAALKRYTNEELLTRRDELRMLWTAVHSHLGRKFTDDEWANAVAPRVTARTRRLYLQHEEPPCPPLERLICEHWLRLEKAGWQVVWETKKKNIKANPRCLPAVLAWACVHHAKQLGFCRNPECPGPYFLARRRDQRYCSEGCAWPAKKAAKLKWWRKHRCKGSKVNKKTKGRKK